jgi:hypothetical protein
MTLLAAWFGNPTPCSTVSLNWPSTCVAPGPQESACWKKGSVTSGLPLGFQGGFPRYLLREFRIAGLLLGFQRGLPSGNLGGLRSG